METVVDFSESVVSWPDIPLDGLAGLLEYGPIGLSALVFILAIVVLFDRQISARRAALMRQFLWGGVALAVFFGVMQFLPSLVAKSVHDVHLSVQPLDLVDSDDFPPAKLTVNSQTFDPPLRLKVGQEITAILDVSAAISYARRLQSLGRSQADSIVESAARLDSLVAELQQASIAAAALSCPSGGAFPSPSPISGAEPAGKINVINLVRSAADVAASASEELRARILDGEMSLPVEM